MTQTVAVDSRASSWIVLLLALAAGSALLGAWGADSDRGWPLGGLALTGLVAGFLVTMLRTGPDHRHIDRAGIVYVLLGVLVLLQTLVGMALFPLTFEEGEDPDPAWFGVVPAISLLLLGGGYLLGMLVAWLVGLPVRALLTNLAGARRDAEARYVSAFAGAFLALLGFATTMAFLALPSVPEGTWRPRGGVLGAAVRILFVLEPLPDEAPAAELLWALAWMLLLTMAACFAVAVRTAVRHRERTGRDLEQVD